MSSQDRDDILRKSKIKSLTDDARSLLDEPSDLPQYSSENIGDHFESLGNMIDSLRVLGSSLEAIEDDDSDDSDDEQARPWMSVQDRSAYEYYVDLISLRFPLVDSNLAEELGKINWSRYNHVSRLGENVQKEIEITETKKSQSVFQDSGIGSSAPPETVMNEEGLPIPHSDQLNYAISIVSSRTSASHKRLPPLSNEARSGMPFECEVCHRTVQIRRTKDWK